MAELAMLADTHRTVYPEKVTCQLQVMAQDRESSPVIDLRSKHCATPPKSTSSGQIKKYYMTTFVGCNAMMGRGKFTYSYQQRRSLPVICWHSTLCYNVINTHTCTEVYHSNHPSCCPCQHHPSQLTDQSQSPEHYQPKSIH